MRKAIFVCLIAVLYAPSVQLGAATALGQSANQVQIDSGFQPSGTVALPDFDARRSPGRQTLRSAGHEQNLERKVNAIEAFRSRLAPEVRSALHYEFNDAGVPKTFFNYESPLTKKKAGSPDKIARGFLTENSDIFGLSENDVQRLQLEGEDGEGGTTFLNYEQTIRRIKVFHGHVQVAVSPEGEVLGVNMGWVLRGEQVDAVPSLSENLALQRAFTYAGRDTSERFLVVESRASRGERAVYENPLGRNYDDVISDLRIMYIDDEAVLAWHSFVDVGPGEWYEICVDAHSGDLLFRYNLYADVAQGTVFAESPAVGGRSVQSFVGDATINTAAGWMGASTVTTGNNVEAYVDTNADNQPDADNTAGLSNGHAAAADQNFTFPFLDGVNPRTQKAAGVANIFYFVNVIHDFTYRLGFTEAAGNFQVNNFGRGGAGNDSVRAEAQDGSGTNNANFGTPPDGSRPRMQQFLFTLGTADQTDDRDGSVDSDVVFHEFGHGVSNRLVGGPANTSCLGGTQAGAMGEGWSDYWACTINGDGVVGEYVTNNPTRGVRRAAYSIPADPVHDSYADLGVGGFEVHRDGEVWAATLWDLRNEIGATISDRIILEGMKFTPCGPSFLNARDGILQADQSLNGGVNRCAIWTVFARHGMGVSATGNNGTTHNAATDVPADCNGGNGVVFADDFETSLGWTGNPNGTDTATTGRWERGNPEATTSNGPKQLGTTTSGVNDLVTGRLAGTSAGANDIDGGTTSVRSPVIALPATGNLILAFNFYLAHGSNASSADFLRVRIVSGTTTTTVFQRLGAAADVDGAWASASVSLNAFAGQTVRILIEAADAGGASLVEAGIDDVVITRQ